MVSDQFSLIEMTCFLNPNGSFYQRFQEEERSTEQESSLFLLRRRITQLPLSPSIGCEYTLLSFISMCLGSLFFSYAGLLDHTRAQHFFDLYDKNSSLSQVSDIKRGSWTLAFHHVFTTGYTILSMLLLSSFHTRSSNLLLVHNIEYF